MRVLIFKANQLGDNVVFLPVVQELARRFPAWELAVVTSPVAAPLYESAVPDPARRFEVSTQDFKRCWRHPREFLAHAWRLMKFQPDACLIAEDQGNVAYLLSALSGARSRVAMERSFIKVRGLATERVAPVPGEKVAVANWRIAAALVQEAGETSWPAAPPPPDLAHLQNAQSARAAGARRRVVIHPGASRAYQCWFPERYVELANRLAGEGGCEVLWLDVLENVAGLDPKIARIRTPSLRDLVQTIESGDLFVGNNSGPMHVANAIGMACVVINGPTSYEWDSPWHRDRMLMLRDESLYCLPCESLVNPANVCVNLAQPMACMKFWTVDAVFQRCLDWMERSPASHSSNTFP